jgi:hypothetical protein
MVTVEGELIGGVFRGEVLFYGGGGGGVGGALGERGLVEVVRGFDLGCEFLVEI